VATRPAKEWILGHEEPLLMLSLGNDYPVAKKYGLLSDVADLDGEAGYHIRAEYDEQMNTNPPPDGMGRETKTCRACKLYQRWRLRGGWERCADVWWCHGPAPLPAGPAYCMGSADVDDQVVGCRISGQDAQGLNTYVKVPSRYNTGKSDLSRIGEVMLYHGKSNFTTIGTPPPQRPNNRGRAGLTLFPPADSGRMLETSNGASVLGSPVQKGFTEGKQFPPVYSTQGAPTLYVLRARGPMVLQFDHSADVTLHGVATRRCGTGVTR
jgi:hypothetical protein